MKLYLTKEQLDNTKTYYRYVDVAVKLTNGESLFCEKLPANKNERKDVLSMMLGRKGYGYTEEVVRKWFRLKEIWSQ